LREYRKERNRRRTLEISKSGGGFYCGSVSAKISDANVRASRTSRGGYGPNTRPPRPL
jgi:hypothetical protein